MKMILCLLTTVPLFHGGCFTLFYVTGCLGKAEVVQWLFKHFSSTFQLYQLIAALLSTAMHIIDFMQ